MSSEMSPCMCITRISLSCLWHLVLAGQPLVCQVSNVRCTSKVGPNIHLRNMAKIGEKCVETLGIFCLFADRIALNLMNPKSQCTIDNMEVEN